MKECNLRSLGKAGVLTRKYATQRNTYIPVQRLPADRLASSYACPPTIERCMLLLFNMRPPVAHILCDECISSSPQYRLDRLHALVNNSVPDAGDDRNHKTSNPRLFVSHNYVYKQELKTIYTILKSARGTRQNLGIHNNGVCVRLYTGFTLCAEQAVAPRATER